MYVLLLGEIEKKENYFASTYPFGLKQKTVCMDSIINVKDFHRVKHSFGKTF